MKNIYVCLLLWNCFLYSQITIACEHRYSSSGSSSQSSTPKASNDSNHQQSTSPTNSRGRASMVENQEWMYTRTVREAESLPIDKLDQMTRQTKKGKRPTPVLVRETTTIGGASNSSTQIAGMANTPESTDSHHREFAWVSNYKYPLANTKIQSIIRSQKLHCCGIVTGLLLMTLNIIITILYSKPCVCRHQ